MSKAMTETKSLSFLERPETERQTIVVIDDDKIDAVKAELKGVEVDLDSSAYATLTYIGWALGGPIGAGILAGIGAAAEGVSSLLQKGEPSYLLMTHQEIAAANVKFPPGHPLHKVVYIKHPFVSDIYYPMAEFHRQLFLHKHLEAVRLLKSLGARRVEVKHESGWSQEMMSKISLPAGVGVEAGAKAGSRRKSSFMVLSEATYIPPKKRSLPKDLIWYPREPNWQAFAEDALNYCIEDFSLVVENEDGFGAEAYASLKSDAAKFKFELGGDYQDFQSTKWTIKATFGRRRKPA